MTFYAYDDLAESPPLRRLWPAYDEAYRRVRERGRGVVAVSPAILSTIEPTGPSAVVPNAVDPAEWARAGSGSGVVRAAARDRDCSTSAASSLVSTSRRSRLRPGACLVPPSSWWARCSIPATSSRCGGSRTCLLRPAVARAEVVGLVAAADACLIPHVRNGLTEAMSPLKLYEYLAGGAPVAALDLPPIRECLTAR